MQFNAADTAFMLVATALVLIMTPGLAFFYGGLIGRKNVAAIDLAPFTRSSSRVRIRDFWTDRKGDEDGTKEIYGRADHHEAA